MSTAAFDQLAVDSDFPVAWLPEPAEPAEPVDLAPLAVATALALAGALAAVAAVIARPPAERA